MKQKILKFIKTETIFFIATILAIITSFISPPKFSYINFHVILILFNLLVCVELFRKSDFLDSIATYFLSKNGGKRTIIILLNILVFLFSAILTNDVALITFVPLTIIIAKKANFSPLLAIILETLSANIGGSLTPMGSPHNLYIYSKYSLNSKEFFNITLPFCLIGLLIILIICYSTKNSRLDFELQKSPFKKDQKLFVGWVIFILVIFSIFFDTNIYAVTFLAVAYLLFLERDILKNIDYVLLLTFVSFFIFSGTFSNISFIREKMVSFLKTPSSVYFISVLASQIISNVPSAIVVSEFTQHWKVLLLGVNVGGEGTLIASLANLIAYKFYVVAYPEKKSKYLKIFSLINFGFLFLLYNIFYFVGAFKFIFEN
ncbi:MAG: SLC13 family permease [Fusobacteriaceae bacterium]